MNNRTANDRPKPLLRYIGDGKFKMNEDFRMDDSAMVHWIFQDLGETYRLTWWGNGWVVNFQESYLTKDLKFAHKNDIPSFAYSEFGDADGWSHVFETREDAVEAFKAHYCKLRGIEPCTDLRLYDEDLPDYSAGNANCQPVLNVEYEIAVNDIKRQIRVLDPQYLSQFVSNFNDLIGE